MGHSWMQTLSDTAGVLMNIGKLYAIGFTTEFGALKASLKPTDMTVQVESANAQTMVELFCGLALHRISSMSTLSRALPGYLALLSSDEDNVFAMALEKLLKDVRVHRLAEQKALAASYIKKLLRSSPFQMRVVREIVLIATLQDPGVTYNHRRHRLRKYNYYMCTGWGQTKVVEDNFKECRYVESQGVLNKTRSMMSYYCAMAQKNTIALHQRKEIFVHHDEPKADGTPQDIFSSKKWTPSLPNSHVITNRATWPTYSPQSSRTIQSDMIVLEHCYDHDAWALADMCGQCLYFQKRSVIHRVGDGMFFMVCGVIASKVLVVWQLEALDLNKSTNHKVFLFSSERVRNTFPTFLVILDLDYYQVVPTSAIAPIHYLLALKRVLPQRMGVVLLQHGKFLPVMLYAAQHAFFNMDLPQLKKICSFWGIEAPGVTLPITLTACIKFFIHKYLKKEPSDAELHAIVSLRCAEEANLVGEICDEDMLIEVLDKDDQQQLKVSSLAIQLITT